MSSVRYTYLENLIAEIVYKSGLTAEFNGKMNTAIHADTCGGILAPPSAANPIKIIGTWNRLDNTDYTTDKYSNIEIVVHNVFI